MDSNKMKLAQKALNFIEDLKKLEAVIEDGEVPKSENKILGNGDRLVLKCDKCGSDLENTYKLTNISEYLGGQIYEIKEYRDKCKGEKEEELYYEDDEYIRNQRFLEGKTLETYGKLKDIEREAKALK